MPHRTCLEHMNSICMHCWCSAMILSTKQDFNEHTVPLEKCFTSYFAEFRKRW